MGLSSKSLYVWLTALRPRQWIKSGLVFVGLVFSLNLTQPPSVLRAVIAFGVLCALASSASSRPQVLRTRRSRPIWPGWPAPAIGI